MEQKLIDLTKKVSIVLEKKNIGNVKAQVGLGIDISGSMQGLYNRGVVQEAVNRLQAVAVKFDDNETLDMWTFNEKSQEIKSAVPSDFGSYVEKHILRDSSVDKWGGTNYAPLLRNVYNHFFGGKKDGLLGKMFSKPAPTIPVFMVILTDGDNGDRTDTIRVLDDLKDKDIYLQFVGIGNCSFNFIREMGDKYGNVGFFSIADLERTTDEQLYDSLLNEEFVGWIKK